MSSELPTAGVEMTHILVMSDVERSKRFYRDVLGAALYREYAGTSVVLNFQGTWLLIVTGGGPARDKPDVAFEPPHERDRIRHAMAIRVPDCQAAYDILRSRGAQFLTPPTNWGPEIRCSFRDPDGHLLEISQAG